MADAQTRWNAIFQELKEVRIQLQTLEERRESFDLIFTTREYIKRLQNTLDALTPHYLQTTGVADAQLKNALEFITENVTSMFTEVHRLREQAAALSEEADQKHFRALSLQTVAKAVAATITS